jgi:hypothetical protein
MPVMVIGGSSLLRSGILSNFRCKQRQETFISERRFSIVDIRELPDRRIAGAIG